MGYAYSNNGLSMRSVGNESNTTTGEVYFSNEATETELASAFSGYADANKEKKISALDTEYQPQFDALAQAYSTALMAGDTTTATEVQEDYATLKTEYTAALEAIS